MKSYPKRKQAAESEFSLSQFATDLGSPNGLDPIPPAQYLQFLQSPDEELRLWGWMLQHTIGRNARSIFAVDTKGRDLNFEHAAADLDIDLSNVYKKWGGLVKIGCVKRDDEGRLVLCGDFQVPKRAKEKRKKPCTNNYSSRFQRELAKLPPKRREEFLREEQADLDAFNCEHRIALNAIRYRLEQKQDIRYKSFGLPLDRQNHGKAGQTEKEKAEELARKRREIQLVLPIIENLVQTIEGHGLYKVESKHVQTTPADKKSRQPAEVKNGYHSAPHVPSEVFTERGEFAHSSSSSGGTGIDDDANQIATLLEELQQLDSLATEKAARELFSGCRHNAPNVSGAEVAQVCREQLGRQRAQRKSIANPTGFCLKAVPPCFPGALKKIRAASQPAPRRQAEPETREMKIERLEREIEGREKIATDKTRPPAERENQKALASEARKQLAALNGKADAVGGSR